MKASLSMLTRSLPALVVVALLACALAAPAAGSPIDVIRDCSEDGALNHSYSQRDLSGALDQLPSDIDEYTNCRSVIRAAQLAGAAGKQSKGKAKGVLRLVNTQAPASPNERRQLERGAHRASPVQIGGRALRPGATGAPLAAAGLGTDLPALVLIVVVALGLAMVAGAAFAAQRRWPRAASATTGTLAGPFRKIGQGIRNGVARFRR
jgi:hypothetical protein